MEERRAKTPAQRGKLMSINDECDLAFRFGTDAISSQQVLRPGDPVSLGLHRSDVIVIPQGETA